MFALTLVDHLRLTFGHVIYAQRAHAQLAARHARVNRWLEAAEAVLLLGVAGASISGLTTGQIGYSVAAVLAAVAALGIVIARLTADFRTTADAHRTCSTRLWRLREEFRALLADIQDGTVTLEAARERREALIRALESVYHDAPPADRRMYEAARSALPVSHEGALADDEVDRFLPSSLRKSDHPPAARMGQASGPVTHHHAAGGLP
jgi:hypothetical protein